MLPSGCDPTAAAAAAAAGRFRGTAALASGTYAISIGVRGRGGWLPGVASTSGGNSTITSIGTAVGGASRRWFRRQLFNPVQMADLVEAAFGGTTVTGSLGGSGTVAGQETLEPLEQSAAGTALVVAAAAMERQLPPSMARRVSTLR